MLAPPLPLSECVGQTLWLLDHCKPMLDAAVQGSSIAAAATQRAEEIDSMSVSGVRSPIMMLAGVSAQGAASELARNEAQRATVLLVPIMFDIERALGTLIPMVMALHATGAPVLPYALPLAQLSILVLDLNHLDPRQAHTDILGLYNVLGGLRAAIGSLPLPPAQSPYRAQG